MPRTITCPTTGKPVSIPDQMLNRKVRCPHCKAAFVDTHPPIPPPPPGVMEENVLRKQKPESGDRQDTGSPPDVAEASALREAMNWYRSTAKPVMERLNPEKGRELEADLGRLEKALAAGVGELEPG